MVLVCEVGGKVSQECCHFLSQLSKFKARDEPPLLQQRVRHAWLHRWGDMVRTGLFLCTMTCYGTSCEHGVPRAHGLVLTVD